MMSGLIENLKSEEVPDDRPKNRNGFYLSSKAAEHKKSHVCQSFPQIERAQDDNTVKKTT
jgi:hypothetical protein